jgi:hypothetical protein
LREITEHRVNAAIHQCEKNELARRDCNTGQYARSCLRGGNSIGVSKSNAPESCVYSNRSMASL